MTKEICDDCGKLEYCLSDLFNFNNRKLCFLCHELSKLDKLKRQTIQEKRTYKENYIMCPWCGENYGEDDIHESRKLKCDSCEKQFNVEVEYDVSYSTERIGDEQ